MVSNCIWCTYTLINSSAVPSLAPNLPIFLQDVPAGDDYYLMLINSTHGVMYSLSSRFSILPAPQNSTNTSAIVQPPSNQQLLATVTVSGAPNPTASFAYTFPPTSGVREARSVWGAGAAVIGVLVTLWTTW